MGKTFTAMLILHIDFLGTGKLHHVCASTVIVQLAAAFPMSR